MPLVLQPHERTGKLVPKIEGTICPTCTHEIPGSANSAWEHPLTHEGGNNHLLAHSRTDILYMTGPSPDPTRAQRSDELLLTLHSLDGFPPHIMLLLTSFLRQKCRDAAFREELAESGIGVASTHDDEPAAGFVMQREHATALLSRILPHMADHLKTLAIVPSAVTYPIAEEALPEIKTLNAQIQQQEQALAAMRQSILEKLQAATGIDVFHRDLIVDLDAGVLRPPV